jgi:hypothetical protein
LGVVSRKENIREMHYNDVMWVFILERQTDSFGGNAGETVNSFESYLSKEAAEKAGLARENRTKGKRTNLKYVGVKNLKG